MKTTICSLIDASSVAVDALFVDDDDDVAVDDCEIQRLNFYSPRDD